MIPMIAVIPFAALGFVAGFMLAGRKRVTEYRSTTSGWIDVKDTPVPTDYDQNILVWDGKRVREKTGTFISVNELKTITHWMGWPMGPGKMHK